MRFRSQEQQYELKGLRERMRSWSEAMERSDVRESGPESALCVVLQQLDDAERAAVAARAAAQLRDAQLSRLQQLHRGDPVAEHLAFLEERATAAESRARELEAAAAAPHRHDARRAPAPAAAVCTETVALRRKVEQLRNKLAEKRRSARDLEQLLRLHMMLRTHPAEAGSAALMTGRPGAVAPPLPP